MVVSTVTFCSTPWVVSSNVANVEIDEVHYLIKCFGHTICNFSECRIHDWHFLVFINVFFRTFGKTVKKCNQCFIYTDNTFIEVTDFFGVIAFLDFLVTIVFDTCEKSGNAERENIVPIRFRMVIVGITPACTTVHVKLTECEDFRTIFCEAYRAEWKQGSAPDGFCYDVILIIAFTNEFVRFAIDACLILPITVQPPYKSSILLLVLWEIGVVRFFTVSKERDQKKKMIVFFLYQFPDLK